MIKKLIFASALITSQALASDLTIVSWGGAYEKAQAESMHKPWMNKSNKSIISESYNGGLSEIKSQVESGNVFWDLVDLDESDALLGCDEGILEPIDSNMFGNVKNDFIKGSITECGIGTIVYSTVIAFNKDAFGLEKPENMDDLFDLNNYPGMRGLRKTAKFNLEFALIADGVPAQEVYNVLSTETGVDRAFAKLDSIKNSIVWFDSGSQPVQMLADGEIVMTTSYNGRVSDAIIVDNQPFEIIWDGQIYDMSMWGIPKGSKNKQNALDFILFSTEAERLAELSTYYPVGSVRKSSASTVGKHYVNKEIDLNDHLPTSTKNFKNAVKNNADWWANHQDEMNERFNKWLNS